MAAVGLVAMISCKDACLAVESRSATSSAGNGGDGFLQARMRGRGRQFSCLKSFESSTEFDGDGSLQARMRGGVTHIG
jgi:hypothetical protein